MKRNLIEPIPVYRTVRVYSTDQATDTVSISIDEVPMRVSQETYLRLKRSAIRNSFYATAAFALVTLFGVGCGPTSRTAYLRDAAVAHLTSCAAFHPSPMNTFWCEADARAFCKANGLETNCWEGR